MTETVQAAHEQSSTAEVRTFLIADVRGYTRFTLEHGDEAAARFASRFGQIAGEVADNYEGRVIELRGDEALAVFTSARQALRASMELQARFLLETQQSSLPYKVGIGLDSGEAIPVEGGYRGASLNLAARLCALAGPGEVLASDTVANLARRIDGLDYAERGSVQVKGFADEIRVVEVRAGSIPSEQRLDSASQAPDHEGEVGGADPPLPIGGFLGALPSGVLVAREEELAKTLSIVDSVATGKGQLVLLAGEPGAGKTRLAQEVTLGVRNRGFLVAAGSSYEPRQTVPYYPFLDALASIYGGASASLRSQVQRRWPYVGRLLPEAGIAVSTVGEQGQEEHDRLFRAVTGFLQAVAKERPIALFLDDLHWADEASLDLLQHLARHTRGDPVLILGTYRDVEINRQHPLGRILQVLHRDDLLEEVPVRRMPAQGTAALVEATMGEAEVSEEFVQLLQRYTEGNPFFTQEVLRALVERGDVYREDGRWQRREIGEIEVPRSVRDAIGERFSRLAPEAQELLREASVLGQNFSFDDLQRMSQASEDDVEAALEQALETTLIRETSGDEYAFNHALTQHALYSELSARRKRRLHLAAAEALQKHPGRDEEKRVAELAWHFLEADDAEHALPYVMLAGDAAEGVFAHREAEKHYRTAIELLQEVTSGARDHITLRAQALEKLGGVLTRLSNHDEAIERLEQALEVYAASNDLEAVSGVTAQIGRVHRYRGTIDEGVECIRDLVEELERPDEARSVSTPSLAALHSVLAALFFAGGKYEESLGEAEMASDLAVSCGDDVILAESEVSRGTALGKIGRGEEGQRVLEKILPLAERVGDIKTLTRALNNLAVSYLMDARYAKSREYFERALEIVERVGEESQLAFATGNVGMPLLWLGDWAAAKACFERALAIDSLSSSSWYSAYPSMQLGHFCFLTGEWDEMDRHLSSCVKIAERSNDLQMLHIVESVRAFRELLTGDHQSALVRMEGIATKDTPGYQAILARAYLESGELDQARKTIEEALNGARHQGVRHDLIDVLLVRGRVLWNQREWDEADKALSEVLTLARDASFPHAEARALYEIGVMNGARGNHRGAVESLEKALAIFRNLGAKPYADLTEKSLTQIGPM